MEWMEVGTREGTGTRVLPRMDRPHQDPRWGTWDSHPRGLEDINSSNLHPDRGSPHSKAHPHSPVTKDTSLLPDISKEGGEDSPLMHHLVNKIPNSPMLDMRLLRLDIASPPPQPIHSGEPLPAPLWPLSQLLPSPPPSSQPSPATVPTDNLQQQLLPQLLPVILQPRGLSHTAHITM